MKRLIAPHWTILALLVCFNSNAQDIIYTISGEINSQKTSLDSITIENLSKQSTAGFGNLPVRDDYRISLTRNEYLGSTSATMLKNESGLFLVKNMPGAMVVAYRGQNTVNANISLHNINGQRLALKENQILENGSMVELEIGLTGVYFLTVSTPLETRSFKATGAKAMGSLNITTQTGAPVPLKSGPVYTLAGSGTEKGDNVKVSVFKDGYIAQPVEMIANENKTLVFPLKAQTAPEVETLEATNILSNSATLNGNVITDGNNPITERGFYWSSSNQNPGEGDNKIVVEGTTGSFSTKLTGLNIATTYYVRAYAINKIGTSCGEQISFTTLAILPTVTTTAISSIDYTDAMCKGNVTSNGGANVTTRGVCWSTSHNPTIADSKSGNGSGTGSFTIQLNSLSAGMTYYVRAYATNSQGTSYGQEIEFKTKNVNWHSDTITAVVDVYNPVTGKTWMDRNLGASRAATSSTDSEAYGDLYQWGRANDGHQKRNSLTTSIRSEGNTPGHGRFIAVAGDWRSWQDNDLWRTVNGININNPCPSGYRLPTLAELKAERLSWSSNNADGAFASPLKLPMAGYRSGFDAGAIYSIDSCGNYWSSGSRIYADGLGFHSSNAYEWFASIAGGNSVRCIKD